MFSPWFISCALVALTTTGIVPILVPLEIVAVQGNPANVGLVMATIGAGMLTSPLWAALAARYSCYRQLMFLGSAGVGLCLWGFDACSDLPHWLVCAFLTGCCVATTFTLANIILVSLYPQDADERISWLQTLVTAGTVLGLVVAGAVEHLPFGAGVWAGGITSALAAALTWSVPAQVVPPPPPQKVSGAPSWSRPLGVLLLLWFLSNAGVSGYTAYYPLVMKVEFAVDPATASYVLAGASALSTLIFAGAGRVVRKLGYSRLMIASLAGRMLALVSLSVLSYQEFPGREYLALALFTIITLLWPLISVSATLLASELAFSKSRGLGYFDGAAALAHLVGPAAAGLLANALGYESVIVFAAASIAVSLLVSPLIVTTRAT